jgi:hypothetical protein
MLISIVEILWRILETHVGYVDGVSNVVEDIPVTCLAIYSASQPVRAFSDASAGVKAKYEPSGTQCDFAAVTGRVK